MPVIDAPTISIYSPAGVFIDWLRAPVAFRATPRWLEVGDAELTVQPGDYRAALLREPGARVRIELRGGHVLGGPVTDWTTQGPGDEKWTFTVTDDAEVLDRVLAFPKPASPLTDQAGSDIRNGKLESVVKSLIGANAPRAGQAIDIAADQGRGPTVTMRTRFVSGCHTAVKPMFAARSWGMMTSRNGTNRDVIVTVGPRPWSAAMSMACPVRGAFAPMSDFTTDSSLPAVWQPDTKRVLIDVVEQREYPIQLSVDTRTITDYRLSSSRPRATRVIMGAADGSTFVQAANAPAEATWGMAGEIFRAATGTDEQSAAGTEALNDAAEKSGMSVALSETQYVRYGGPGGLLVGDRATLRIGDVSVTDVVREAVITWEPGSPLTIKPGVGAWDSSPAYALADAVRRMGATLRRWTSR